MVLNLKKKYLPNFLKEYFSVNLKKENEQNINIITPEPKKEIDFEKDNVDTKTNEIDKKTDKSNGDDDFNP